ncbi:inhibitory synaptic factor 2A [Sarcophilus harrisii]|uniref:Inhibitory synaptic factor 2A n=1 Tax=Sarcophilus harrisii TaxID=9305 RepID=A0A7N4V296_SARHA|nr:inhibitory synaptic factor 2A [Sarcophilus harrisii]XP_031812882.1 inhibitory synaptic factor 2A [Sarcophilus harrisii]
MVSKEPGKCLLTPSESEADPAASLALEMRYALDANRQIKKRNKALQVRFKDICEAQSEQRDRQLAAGSPADRREAKPVSYKAAAYRKYMTVPARRSIPNVTRSTGVQTSPDLKKCYQTFPLDRKKGGVLKGSQPAGTFKSQNNGFLIEAQEQSDGPSSGEAAECGKAGSGHKARDPAALSEEHVNAVGRAPGDSCAEACKPPDPHSCVKGPGHPNAIQPPPEEPDPQPVKLERALPDAEDTHPSAQGRLFKTEVAAVYLPASGAQAVEPTLANSGAESEWSLCPATEEKRRTGHLNGLHPQADNAQACPAQPQCPASECGDQALQRNVSPTGENPPCRTAVAVSEECREIVPHTEVIDLKAQLQMMESLISSSQETIKVLLGVIQELEKGEAHREGLSYRTGQDTANCATCRNSACIIYSVELDFKQQEDKLQPVLRKLHPIEETQVAPLPYSPETYSSTPKQKSKTESKKHGRWRLWFL